MAAVIPVKIEILDEGSTQGKVKSIDFVGTGVSATVSGDAATITVSGGGGGVTGSGTSPRLAYWDSGSSISSNQFYDITSDVLRHIQTASTANTVVYGYHLNNTTTASSGNQMYSGAIRFTGQGWKTNATAASQSVEMRQYLLPVQGAAAPTATMYFDYSVNGGAFSNIARLLSTGVFQAGDGSLTTPAYGFTAETNSGMYRVGAANIGIVLGGAVKLDILNSVIRGQDGSAATPGWGFINDTNTGFYRVASDQIGVSCGNSQTMVFTNTQNLAVVGSASAPGYSFNGDSNTGFYRSASDVLNITTGGTSRMDWSTTTETYSDGYNTAFGTTTGTKMGTATTQKMGFWNATPIVQPTTAVAAATFVANTSSIADDTATFDGYTIGQVVKALRNSGLLA